MDASPGTMFVIVHVTDAGVVVVTVTVPAVNVLLPPLSVALNRPKVKPATRVATAPMAVIIAPARREALSD